MKAGNVIGVDPHRQTLTATVLDARGGEIDHAHYANTTAGHTDGRVGGRSQARSNGGESKARVASAAPRRVPRPPRLRRPRRPTTQDIGPATRPPRRQERPARLAPRRRRDPDQPPAGTCVQARRPAAPDAKRDQIALWHNARKSMTKIRVQPSASSTPSSTTSPKSSAASSRR